VKDIADVQVEFRLMDATGTEVAALDLKINQLKSCKTNTYLMLFKVQRNTEKCAKCQLK
jgi:hypothetical protein